MMSAEFKQAPARAFQEGDVVLTDGSTVNIRQIRPGDEEQMVSFFLSLSEQSRWMRFCSMLSDASLIKEVRREAALNSKDGFGLVAVTGADQRLVGHAFYVRVEGEVAEVAFAVADEFQGRGLGTILLGQLAEVAATNDISVFEADVLASNHRMLEVFRRSGFHPEITAEAGQIHVTFPISFTPDAIERFDQRERIAAVNALGRFLHPRSIAVIGASRRRGTVGGEIFHNLLSYGFTGPVYAVNPAAKVVQSVPAYPSVEDLPDPIDLAVIVVPAAQVLDAARQCGRKAVRALVVISAGFAETGDEGRARQAELLQICRSSGMRLIGPNCMGIINTSPEFHLDATFAPGVPPPGRVGFSSQSGALGLAIIEYANSLGLGISSFLSVGNKADISGNDLLRYWESDPDTDVILLYLESFGNPRKFGQIARRVGRSKPIVVVKSGRSSAGARAATSHTGALLASSDVTVDALFRQAGVIRTDTLEELFSVGTLLANQPVPAGGRVGIITNAGGPAILCADACEARNLVVPTLEAGTQEKLRSILLPGASCGNPVDMIAAASPDNYLDAIRLVGNDPNVDSVIVIFAPPLVNRSQEIARAIAEGARGLKASKPIITVFMSTQSVADSLNASDLRIPSYSFPESAAIALSRAAWYGAWRRRPVSSAPVFDDIRTDEAAAIVSTALLRGDTWLEPEEIAALLACYGLPLVEQRIVHSPEEAGLAAEEIGGEVALKAAGEGLLHKTEIGAVRLRLQGREQVITAAWQIAGDLESKGLPARSFVVQRMAEGGVEMLVGVACDRQFGPVVACGAGGTQVELMKDVSVRLSPLTKDDACEMIRGLKTYPLLSGFRGAPSCDVPALEDALLRVSRMVEDLPQIAELDCNPLLVRQNGAVILDARIRVAPAEPRPLLGVRS
jgi:acetyl coenzyme A synthetase (ADP forming)-like protein